jgi:predicted P-loop ATPase
MSNLPEAPAGRNPAVLAPNASDVLPAYLREMKRWTAWKYLPPKKPGAKPAKFPRSLTNDANTWRSLGDALKEAAGGGVGFMMLGANSLVGIDLDGCVDPTTGATTPFATALLAACQDTYAELSPSGKGVRLFALAPPDARIPEFLSATHGVECYVGKSSRFLTVTGNVLEGRAGKLAEIPAAALKMLAPLATAGTTNEVEIKLPVPLLERAADWKALFDKRLPYQKVKQEWQDYLERGDIPGARSEKSFGLACRLLECRYVADEVFAILLSAPGSWEAALDKRDQDVNRARALIWADIGRAQKIVRADTVDTQARVDSWSGLGLRTVLKAKRVTVERSQMNAMRILTDHEDWRGRIALDITSGRVLLDHKPLDDHRFFEMQEKVSNFVAWEPANMRQWWADVARAVAETNPINPREAELRAFRWDGVERLDTWFVDHVADEDDPLNRMLGRMWLLSCVARWVDPGCKVDTVLVLQGVEGARKNTFYEIVAGGADRVVACEGMEREDKLVLAKAWLAEMPEASIFRKADRNRLKGFITRPIDDFRPPYAANPGSWKRGFVLVSTSNSFELFNTDQDGLRRFWPVWVKSKIDYKWIEAHREQLLAEAVFCYDLGEQWWFEETPQALKERVEFAVESTALDEAVQRLVEQQVGKGGLSMVDAIAELNAILGQRPRDRDVSTALVKHGVRQRRSATSRFWLHPAWARPGANAEADIIPIRKTAKPGGVEEVLS